MKAQREGLSKLLCIVESGRCGSSASSHREKRLKKSSQKTRISSLARAAPAQMCSPKPKAMCFGSAWRVMSSRSASGHTRRVTVGRGPGDEDPLACVQLLTAQLGVLGDTAEEPAYGVIQRRSSSIAFGDELWSRRQLPNLLGMLAECVDRTGEIVAAGLVPCDERRVETMWIISYVIGAPSYLAPTRMLIR